MYRCSDCINNKLFEIHIHLFKHNLSQLRFINNLNTKIKFQYYNDSSVVKNEPTNGLNHIPTEMNYCFI